MHKSVGILSTLIVAVTWIAGAWAADPPPQPATEDMTGTMLQGSARAPSATPPSLPPPPPPGSAKPPPPPPPYGAQPPDRAPPPSAGPPPNAPPAAAASAAPSAVSRQPNECARPRMRDGFYLRVSSGFGYVSMAGSGPKGNASVAGFGSLSLLAIGGTMLPGLVVAGTLQASSSTSKFKGGPYEHASVTSEGKTVSGSSKATAAASQLGLLFDWYPSPMVGWHVGLSGGLGIAAVVNQVDESALSGTAMSGTVFGGYDWSLGSQWSTGISLFASGVTATNMKDKDGHDAKYSFKSYSIGLLGSLLYF